MQTILTNEILYYGGLITAVCAAAAGIIFFAALYICRIKLNHKLDKEYGDYGQKK